MLWNPGYSDLTADWQALRSAAEAMKVTLLPFEARSAPEYEPAFAAMAAQRVDAVITFTDAQGYVHRQALALCGRGAVAADLLVALARLGGGQHPTA